MEVGTPISLAITAQKLDRNRSIFIASELARGDNVEITVTREIIHIDPTGKQVQVDGDGQYTVIKSLADIAQLPPVQQAVTLPPQLGGITLNYAQIAYAMQMLTDAICPAEAQAAAAAFAAAQAPAQ